MKHWSQLFPKFTRKNPPEDSSQDIQQIANQNLEYSKKILKEIRRMGLLSEAQHLLLNKWDKDKDRDQDYERKASPLKEEDALDLLDLCDKLMLGMDKNHLNGNAKLMKDLVEGLKEKILALSRLVPTATLGEGFSSSVSQVIEGEYQPHLKKGTVTGIISQGYRRADATLVRQAKVIVSTDQPLS